jgi:hypothetical protein
MNFTTQLSIKSALRFALPCIASCLLLSACSNEGSEMNPDNANPTAPGTIRFTASAPMASDAATTRIGIDSNNKPDVTSDSDWDSEEPVIWLKGDAVSVFFVPTAGGSPIHAKFVVDDESISDDGKSAELVNDINFNPSVLDGEYTIRAFSPYASTNSLSNITLDLSSQSQSVNADATNYSHLGNTAAMRAYGGQKSFANGSLTGGDVDLYFEYLTLLLRFHIKNGTGEAINVTSISLTHPSMGVKTTYNLAMNSSTESQKGSPYNLAIGGSSGYRLLADASFDAYMSAFPTHIDQLYSGDLKLSISVADGESFDYEINASFIAMSDDRDEFTVGTRFLFDIILNKLVPPTIFEFDGYYYTHNTVASGVTYYTDSTGDKWVSRGSLYDACESPSESVTSAVVETLNLRAFYDEFIHIFGGKARTSDMSVLFRDQIAFRSGISYIYIDGDYIIKGPYTSLGYYYRPLCRTKISE